MNIFAASLKDKKIVVTGGAGFIGSHIVDALVKAGATVTVIDNLSTGKKDNLVWVKDAVTFIEGDITDVDMLKKAFAEAYAVIHHAAVASVPQSIAFPKETYAVNVTGTQNVFQAARDAGVDRVIYATSSAVYGDDPAMPKVETMKTAPISPYGEHKLANEIDAKKMFDASGLKTIGLRYFNVFGSRQNPFSEYSAVIPKFISLMKKGSAPSIYGDGMQTRDFIYVTDIVQANMKALEAKAGFGEVYNVATGGKISLNDLVAKLNVILGSTFVPNYLPAKQGDIKDSYADITKARTVLNFEPQVTFEEGLKKTVENL
ncbi:MAG: SDR family oxidoreductase [Patescibacteria group bacterium]